MSQTGAAKTILAAVQVGREVAVTYFIAIETPETVIATHYFGAFIAKFDSHGPENVHVVAGVETVACAVIGIFSAFGIEAEVAVLQMVAVVDVFAVFVGAVLEIYAWYFIQECFELVEKWFCEVKVQAVIQWIPFVGPPD